jgi:hypothetical protein
MLTQEDAVDAHGYTRRGGRSRRSPGIGAGDRKTIRAYLSGQRAPRSGHRPDETPRSDRRARFCTVLDPVTC